MPIVAERAEGVWLWDVEGRRYLDCISAYSSLNQGHRHPRIIAALVEQSSDFIGVADGETWPNFLGQLLQPGHEVFNFGIPGHSSVEHKKLLPRVLADFSPDGVNVDSTVS